MPVARERGGEVRGRRVELAPFIWLVLTCGGALIGLELLFNVHRPSEADRRRACFNNLRQISYACMMYADENDDQFPDELERLYPGFIDNPRCFSCPSEPSNWRDFDSGDVAPASSSYTLVSGLRATAKSSTIVVYESTDNHHGVRLVAYPGGRVERLSEAEFQKRFQEQHARLSKCKPITNEKQGGLL